MGVKNVERYGHLGIYSMVIFPKERTISTNDDEKEKKMVDGEFKNKKEFIFKNVY